MIDNLSIAVYVFASNILMSFSLDEKLLPRSMNLSISFRETSVSTDMSFFLIRTYLFRFVSFHTDANATYCLHHIDADKRYREKARSKLHMNATRYIEEILEATSQKAAAVRPFTPPSLKPSK